MHLHDLLDPADLQAGIDAKLITVRTADDGQRIYNYSDAAMWTPGAWDNPAVRACRGLITDPDGQVVARPWAKFFNHGQPEAGDLDLHAPVEVTDKLDGSLGIIHRAQDGRLRVATRGSFASEQAIHATKVLRERYADTLGWLGWDESMTVLVEIVYPGNRIVCDYGGTDDLILLGSVHNATGSYHGPAETAGLIGWDGPVTQTFAYATLAEALAAPERPGMEGFCVRYLDRPHIVKIKQAEYITLHRLITGLSERVLWTHLAAHACKHLITDPQHWGTYLGMDPAEAAKSLELGEDWLEAIITTGGVPDEVLGWVTDTIANLIQRQAATLTRGRALAASVAHLPAREQHAALRDDPLVTEALYLARGSSEDALIRRSWREVYPDATRPFYVSEEAA